MIVVEIKKRKIEINITEKNWRLSPLFLAHTYRLRPLFFIFHRKKAANPLSANPTKWSKTLKQFVGKLPTNCLSVFDHFVGLALKGLKIMENIFIISANLWRRDFKIRYKFSAVRDTM